MIGELFQNQGMVTYEGKLNADSTFYIPSQGLVNFSAGKFRIFSDTIEFVTEQGADVLFDVYTIDTAQGKIYPLRTELDESLYLKWIEN